MDLIELFYRTVRFPDRRKTSGLCGHYIYADTIVNAQVVNALSYKFHYFVIYITVFKYGTDNCQRNILRAYTLGRFTGKMYCHDTWHRDVICLLQKLFYDLWSAFSYCHGSQCTIAGMAV